MAERNESVEVAVRAIRRVTRKKYSAEEKVRIVLEALRGESDIAGLCLREVIPTNLYYRPAKVAGSSTGVRSSWKRGNSGW